jgi:hypothetical protein
VQAAYDRAVATARARGMRAWEARAARSLEAFQREAVNTSEGLAR